MLIKSALQAPVHQAYQLIRVDTETLTFLQTILKKVKPQDPFLRSAGYFAMTGRKGLWVYGNDDNAMIVMRHPNREQTILFFPPFGPQPEHLIVSALQEDSWPCRIELARVGCDHQHLIDSLVCQGHGRPHQETILDWTYPAHIIATRKLIERDGPTYRSFRNRLNRAFKIGFTGRPIDYQNDQELITSVVNQWATTGNKPQYSRDDLTGPTKYLHSLMKKRILKLGGVITFEHNNVQGFWIWEEDRTNDMALSLVRISLGKRGCAEFGAFKMAQILKERGIGHFCTGGSETKGLDDFKRKFNPITSIPLKTMTLRG